MSRAATTLFEDAIDVPLWLEGETLTPYAERARRDRAIALGLATDDPVARVRGWWQSVERSADAGYGERIGRLRSIVSFAMAVFGALAGVAVTLAAFSYDGSQPVNIVRLLALLVGGQLVLLILTLLLLPGRVPGLKHLQDLLAALNPGAWASAVFRKLVQVVPGAVRVVDLRAPRAAVVRFGKWQMLYWSQTAAVAFNCAALAAAVALVTFSDLAFGWSTTLEVDPAYITGVVRAVAAPWAAWLPAAVPSAELVEQSQFFRLEREVMPVQAVRALGAWWPFTILALVTYGLAPRMVLLALSAVRLRAATKALLLEDPQVTALLDRMTSPDIETAAAEHEAPPLEIGRPPAVPPPLAGQAQALVWESSVPPGAVREYARRHLGLDVTSVSAAGGGDLASDRAALESFAATGAQTLLVLTPAWEPPLLELLDFLAELRRRAGVGASIIVAPVPDGPRAVTDIERATWTRAVGKLADPKLYVETGAT